MNEELLVLIAGANEVADNVQNAFGGLVVEQLNWSPDAESWSIGQCLDHLIVTNERDFPAIENTLKENYQNPFWGKMPFLSRFFGGFLVKMCRPENTRRSKAPKIFRPAEGRISGNIVEDFVRHQQKVVRFFELSENQDLKKTKVASLVTSFVTYSLLDAYRVLVLHEQRHFGQAKRVMETTGFPA